MEHTGTHIHSLTVGGQTLLSCCVCGPLGVSPAHTAHEDGVVHLVQYHAPVGTR